MGQLATLVDRAQHLAITAPAHVAYTFLDDAAGTVVGELSHDELDRRARAVAARLQADGLAGKPVLLLYPQGLEYIAGFFGCLYAGAIAVPVYPPNPKRLLRTLPRLLSIVEDARPEAILAPGALIDSFGGQLAMVPSLAALRWIASDRECDSAAWKQPDIDADSIAFLQYTSGSTASPRGVCIRHRNLVANAAAIARSMDLHTSGTLVSWLPLYHDMGLIGGVVQPLFSELRTVLMSPLSFLAEPVRWLFAVTRFRATHTGAPNFAYDLCRQRISDADLAQLDLSSLELLFNGAEPLRPETVRGFSERFAAVGFRPSVWRPCYGLAEATLLVAAAPAGAARIEAFSRSGLGDGFARGAPDDAQELVSSGVITPDHEVRIVDPVALVAVPDGRIGEVWVAGPSVASGYWRRPEDSAAIFQARLGDGGRYLRTGDLGFLRDGELFITGRAKDMIIVRGRNYFPQDIERAAERSHAVLRPGCVAAFALTAPDRPDRIVVVQEADPSAGADTWRIAVGALRSAVAEDCDLRVDDVVLVSPGEVPKTSSGKIQRRLCAKRLLAGELQVLLRQDGAELPDGADGTDDAEPADVRDPRRYLRALFGQLLGHPVDDLDPARPVVALGVDSLTAIAITNAIARDTGLTLSPVRVLSDLTVGELVALIAGAPTTTADAPPPGETSRVATPDSAPLSPGQLSLWFLYRLAPESSSYNQLFAARTRDHVDVAALRRALDELVRRHTVLRTTYDDADGTPRQRVHAELAVELSDVDARGWTREQVDARLAGEAHRPFDLSNGPLVRVLLLRRDEETLLLLGTHHIVMDFWSVGLLVAELGHLYAAARADRPATLPPVPSHLAHLADLARRRDAPEGAASRAYWHRALAGELAVLDLPIAGKRPRVQTYDGDNHTFTIAPPIARAVRELARSEGTTLYTVGLAAYQALLARFAGRHEVVVGSPTANRHDARYADTIGYFVNMVAMRADLRGPQSFRTLVRRTRGDVLDALTHQAYPFSVLVDELEVNRDASRHPIFQAAFLVQRPPRADEPQLAYFVLGVAGARITVGDMTLESIALPQRLARFDLELWLVDDGESMLGSLRYNTDLFTAKAISQLAEAYTVLLSSAVGDPDARLSRHALLSDARSTRMLQDWNATAAPYDTDVCLQTLFEAAVARDPDATAVVCRERRLSYREVNAQSNQLAWWLMKHGLAPGDNVAVLLDRGAEMIPALLGTLKAGGAYVPMEPAFPAVRVAHIVARTGVRIVITNQRHAALFAERERFPDVQHVVSIDAGDLAALPTHDPPRRNHPGDVAYTIFTSGSTGMPKGVVVTHRPVVNLIGWVNRTFGVGPADRMLFVTSLCFDLSVYDVFGILAAGGSIHVADDAEVRDPVALGQLLAGGEITFWDSAPAALRRVVPLLPAQAHDTSRLRLVFLSGDWVPVTLPDEIRTRFPGATVVALGGATEAAIWSNFHVVGAVDPAWPSIPYGRPITNARYYVLDEEYHPCPVGVPGELYIGGECLAVGYGGEPTVTATKFVPDPHSPRPGATMYRTGDRARFWDDGTIEFLGRLDHMVKIRGFRVEPGEVETLLNRHPAVREALVVADADGRDDARLVAYVVPQHAAEQDDAGLVQRWSTVFENVYARANPEDAAFNIAGWTDSYRGAAIAGDQMREWVDGTVRRLLAVPHASVLEIGCGTGLLLARVAPSATRYVATDVSEQALAFVRERLLPDLALPDDRVELHHLGADDIAALGAQRFDLVVINSVAQYFPHVRYLVDVVRQALAMVAPGGAIFVGDVRNRALLRALHTSVQLEQAAATLATDALRHRVDEQESREAELTVDPALFAELRRRFPAITDVAVLLKPGAAINELTAFRYDVILTVAGAQDREATRALRWGQDLTELCEVEARAAGARGVVVTDLPNARVTTALAAVAALAEPGAGTVADLRARASGAARGQDPADAVRRMCATGWLAEAAWPLSGDPGRFDLVLRRSPESIESPASVASVARTLEPSPPAPAYDEADATDAAWERHANDPGEGDFRARLVPRLRSYLGANLPEYLVPSVFVLLRALPVTANGKVDRAALPAPSSARIGGAADYVAASTQVEQRLARIWCEVLGIDRVGIHDRYFELGGDSILSIQIMSRAAQEGLRFQLRDLFQYQTIAELAQVVTVGPAASGAADEPGEVALTAAQRWFFSLEPQAPHHFNQSVMVELAEPAQPAALERALAAVGHRHHAFGLSHHRTATGWRQELAQVQPIPLAIVELAGHPAADRERLVAERVAAANAELDLGKAPLAQAVLFRGEADRVLLVVHHLVVDGVSWRILLADLQLAYEQARAGGAPALPEVPVSLVTWARAETARTDDAARDLPRWTAHLQKPMPRLPAPAVRRPDTSEGAGRTVRRRLGLDDTTALLGPALAAYRMKVDEVLLAALASAMRGWWGCARLRVDLERHGRDAEVDLSRTVGWFTRFVPILVDLGAVGAGDIGGELVAVKECVRAAPGDGSGFGLLRGRAETASWPEAEISLNHLGSMDLAGGMFRLVDGAGPMRAATNQRPYRWEINTHVASGCLVLEWTHSPDCDPGDVIDGLADATMAALERAIAHCRAHKDSNYTPADFPLAGLDRQRLERLLRQVRPAPRSEP
jgi:amino acid adenylation domain-containing protein/non-ribosomal peptide synthase protein (TIGR01720 family)